MKSTFHFISVIQKQKRCLLFLILLVIFSLLSFQPIVLAQNKSQETLSEDEKREAVELSRAFTKRLGESMDLGAVMNELFLPDSVDRFISIERKRASESNALQITFAPGISINVSLLKDASAKDWRHFYIATNTFLLFGLINSLQHNADFESTKPTDMYPPAIIALLDSNPMLSNFILKKGATREFQTVEEMRSAMATLDQAISILRKELSGSAAQREDLEKTILQMLLKKAAPTRRLTEAEIEKVRAELIQPQLEATDTEALGFLKGTKLIAAYAFPVYELIMAKVNGKLRIIWAYLNPGD